MRPQRPPPPRRFPDPWDAPAEAPLALGGDLEPETLADAYRHGIFPWPAGDVLTWWSPDPRAVLALEDLHVSRSLGRTLRSGRFRTTADCAFSEVVAACADRDGEASWITPALAAAYRRLHERSDPGLGVTAHSVETWDHQDMLVGGVYGLAVGGVFCGESMFHRARDASKVAFVELVGRLRAGGFSLLDAQVPSAHLATLGVRTIPRRAFLSSLRAMRDEPTRWQDEGDHRPPGGHDAGRGDGGGADGVAS